MRLRNTTPYDTAALRAVLEAALRDQAVDHAGLDVWIRKGEYSGNAQLGRWMRDRSRPAHELARYLVEHDGLHPRVFRFGQRMRLSIPVTGLDIAHFARLVEHEVAHLRGITHRQMSPRLKRVHDASLGSPVFLTALVVPGAVDGQLAPLERIRTAATASEGRTRELVAKRAAHAREKLAEHEAKLSREERLVHAWARKVTYYAKKGV